MSQQPRSRSAVAASSARAALPDAAAPNAVAAPASPAPSNAPTIFLLILVVGMMAFIAWWAFLGKGARASANAVLASPPRLNAVPARLKPSPKPVPDATPARNAAVAAGSARDAAPDDVAPVINEVPAPATARQKPAMSGGASRALPAATAAQDAD